MATGFFHEKEGIRSVSRLIFNEVSPAVVLAFFSGVEGVLVGLKLGQKPMETPRV